MDRVSECTVCPEWIVRCVHFEKQSLWLFPPFKGELLSEKYPHHDILTWQVLGPGELRPCGCGTHLILPPVTAIAAVTLEEAESVFNAEEERWHLAREQQEVT